MGYPKLGDFEETAQKPTVCFNTQPATEPTEFSYFQLDETNCSNQSMEAPSDFPTVFSHEPTSSTSGTLTVSAGRIFKAISLESTAFGFKTRHT